MSATLFDDLRRPLCRYVQGLGLPHSDAEDIAQDTFVHLLHHLAAGKPRDNLSGWIFRVGHNLALKRRQRLQRHPVCAPEDADRQDPAPDPEQSAAARKERLELLAVVRALPEADRRCLALRAEGLRYRDIAAELDVSLGWVSTSLGRSLAKLSIVRQRHGS